MSPVFWTRKTLSERIPDARIRATVRPLLDQYIERAVKPLLHLPEAERDRLPYHVEAIANHTVLLHLDLMARFQVAVEIRYADRTIEDFWDEVRRGLVQFRSDCADLFGSDYIGCVEAGVRIHLRVVFDLLSHSLGEVFENAPADWLMEVAFARSRLDLCLLSILEYLDSDAAPERAAIPEQLCYLVKKYALSHAAVARRHPLLTSRHKKGLHSHLDSEDRKLTESLGRAFLAGLDAE